MRIEIRGRNVEMTDDLREMVRKRFQRLGRQVSAAGDARGRALRGAQPLDRRQPGGRGDLPLKGVTLQPARLAGDDAHRARAGRGLRRQVKKHRELRRKRSRTRHWSTRCGAAPPSCTAVGPR